MADVWVGRFNRFFEKILNIKGGPALVDLDPAIQASWELFSGIEDRYAQGWNEFSAQRTIAAVAANFGNFRFRNPTASGVIAVIESLVFTTSGATDTPIINYGAGITDLSSPLALANSRLDPRGNPQPSSILSTQTGASAPQGYMIRNCLPNTNAEFINTINSEIPVLPGNFVDLFGQVANNQMVFSVRWRERVLETSEFA